MMMNKKVKTPCIGVCSTGIGDTVCRGCKRFAHEIINWNCYTETQRQLVITRLDQFLATVVTHKIDIFDEKKLLAQAQYQQLNPDETLSSARWVYELIRVGSTQIKTTEAYGFRIKPDWQHLPLTAIKEQLDQDFYHLSTAHYARYIAHNV